MGDERNAPVVGHRLLVQLVDLEGDDVPLTSRLDHGRAGRAVQRMGHWEQRLQGVALGAAGGTDISLAGAGAARIIEDVDKRIGREAAPVIADRDLAAFGRYIDRNFGWDLGLFALV